MALEIDQRPEIDDPQETKPLGLNSALHRARAAQRAMVTAINRLLPPDDLLSDRFQIRQATEMVHALRLKRGSQTVAEMGVDSPPRAPVAQRAMAMVSNLHLEYGDRLPFMPTALALRPKRGGLRAMAMESNLRPGRDEHRAVKIPIRANGRCSHLPPMSLRPTLLVQRTFLVIAILKMPTQT